MVKKIKINIFSENIFDAKDINEKKFIDIAKKVLKFYMAEIYEHSCFAGHDFDTVSFDFLYFGFRI